MLGRSSVRTVLTVMACATLGAQPAPQSAMVHLAISLVDSDLNLKPVPRHALLIRKDGSAAEPIRVVTGIDGKADVVLDPGNYTLESERAIDFQGHQYRWKVPIILRPGETKGIDLSSDSAVVDSSSAPPKSSSDLPTLFKTWQASVVTVWTDTGHGSGFLIDSRGLILTNQHVVGQSSYAAVQFSDTIKAQAQIVAKSTADDIAILRVYPGFVKDIPPVRLGFTTNGVAPVEGEQVFTIGSPLNQRKVMTTGIVSKVEGKVLISDVNINHGNSGGPLFTMNGDVVGVTTFADLSGSGGPGISGVIRIDQARALIDQAQQSLVAGPAPSDLLLPVEPVQAFPIEGLKATLIARPVKPKEYSLNAADFEVTFVTPVLSYGVQVAEEQLALAERTKRNRKATAPVASPDPFADFRNWAGYVGEFRPVLIVDARPKLVEGFWSGLSRGLAAVNGTYAGPAQLHFKSDFSRMRLLCGTRPIEPIHPGRIEYRASANNAAVNVNDVTYEGFYIYPPDAISPSCGTVTLELFNEKEPNKADVRIISLKLMQRVWDDFAAYRSVAR